MLRRLPLEYLGVNSAAVSKDEVVRGGLKGKTLISP
jgi:hypothetical protein